jgi:nitrate/nitrite transporter NarK
LAGAITPAIALGLASLVGWRGVFVVFGMLGIVWVFAWHQIFRDEPSEHPDVNEAEAALIAAGREPAQPSAHEGWPYWRRLLGHRNTWPLCFAYVANSFAFYFCITWLPTYLHEQHGIAGVRSVCSRGCRCWSQFWATSEAARSPIGPSHASGCALGEWESAASADGAAGLTMLAATSATTPLAAVGLISLAVGATMLTLGATLGVCQEIGGAHVGVVGAAMNTVGQLGGIAVSTPRDLARQNLWQLECTDRGHRRLRAPRRRPVVSSRSTRQGVRLNRRPFPSPLRFQT